MAGNKIILNLEKTRISNTEYYMVHNVNLPKETCTKRVADGWINISQSFKLETTYSNQSKRQKIIEKEESSGNINVEKVIGGWGRIQGSWVSPQDAIYLFKKYSFKNFVNLTILMFKESEEEPLPVKQDVKNYHPLEFEFDAVDETLANSSKKENKTPKTLKLKNGNKAFQEQKKKNAYKRASLTQITPENYYTTGYAMKHQNSIPASLDDETVKNEETPLQIRTENESNNNPESPFKKMKMENGKDRVFAFDANRVPHPVIQSSKDNKQQDASSFSLKTPFNAQSGRGHQELSTFKKYNDNSFQFESNVKPHAALAKNMKDDDQDDRGPTSPLNKKFHQLKASTIPSAQTVKTPRMNGEKFKNLIIKALETDSENDEIVTILYATNFPKNLDPNFQVDKEGNTALHWATAQGNVKLVAYLVEVLKSDPFKTNSKGMNCISKSLFFDNNQKNDSFQAILTLLSNCLIIQDDNGKLPLHYITDLCSVKAKDINVSIYYLTWILKFLTIEVDVPIKNPNGSNEVVITRQNFLKNALNYQDRDGNTPLHTLAVNGNVQLYNHFVSLGAVPSVPNLKGETPHNIMERAFVELNKNMTSKLKDPVSLGSGTVNSDSSEKYGNIENSQSIMSDETELQDSSQIHQHEFMNDKKPPILRLEKHGDYMEDKGIKVDSTNPFKSISQPHSAKGNTSDLRNYFTYDTNMFQHYDTMDSRNELQASRAYSKSRSAKLAPLNITKINSANNTVLKRSPDLSAMFMQRNRLNNQTMVSALKAFNDRLNETYGTLNKIYEVRERKIIDLEKKTKTIDRRNTMMHELHASYELEKSKLRKTENDINMKVDLKTIHNEWKSVIQESLIAQLTLKAATVVKKRQSNSDTERLAKLQKIAELLKLDKIKTRMFSVMDDERNIKEEAKRRNYVKFVEKMIHENRNKEK